MHAARIRNYFLYARISTMSSTQFMSGTTYDFLYFCTFRCLAWHHVPKKLRSELDAKSRLSVTMGCYLSTQYKVWLRTREKASMSSDFTIFENNFRLCEIESDVTDSWEPPVRCEGKVVRGKELIDSATSPQGPSSGSALWEEQATMKDAKGQTFPLSEKKATPYPRNVSLK